MDYNVQIHRYGFVINFTIEKIYSGFYWKCSSFKKEETGFIEFKLLKKTSSIFVETSFTPENIIIYPIYTLSKNLLYDPVDIIPGKWILKFTNLKKSSATIQISSSPKESYDSNLIYNMLELNEIKTYSLDINIIELSDKLFFKKNNYSQDQIILSNFYLINKVSGETLVSDETLIKPEYSNISRKNGNIVFDFNSPIWSFFSIKFYVP
jgi:hypothetical protein